jgi:hypothetical protein
VQEYKEMPCLLILHRRFTHIETILSRVSDMGIKKIYLALDGPKSQDEKIAQKNFLLALNELCRRYEVSYTVSSLSENRGIFINMVTALDWFFEENSFGIILEDDTIPELKFGDFVSSARHVLEECSQTMMISGWRNQESASPFQDGYELSSFPLIWGWATSQKKWKVIKTWFFEGLAENPSFRTCFTRYHGYWRAGYKRAISGRLDSWAIVLAYNFLVGHFKSIVPQTSLVKNVGLDEFSTNSRMLRNRRGHINSSILSTLDQSLTYEIYQISYRHIFAPIYAPVLDFFSKRSKRVSPIRILKSANEVGLHGRKLREAL